MFAEIFKDSNRVHDYPAVATTQKRGEWTHHTCGARVTDTEDSKQDDKYSVMPPLI